MVYSAAKILGVGVHDVTMRDALKTMESFIDSGKPHIFPFLWLFNRGKKIKDIFFVHHRRISYFFKLRLSEFTHLSLYYLRE